MKHQHISCSNARVAALAFCLAGFAAVAAPVTNVVKSADSAKPYQTYTYDTAVYVPFDATTTVTVECPDPAAEKWLKAHFKEWFGKYAPNVKLGATGLTPADDPEAYAASADETGVKIVANTLMGARWAAYTLRQQLIAKRGTFKTEGYILPKLSVTDRPHLAFL